VLFDEKTEEGVKGRNFAYKSIYVGESVEIGQTHTVEITNVTKHSLVGKIAS
jgi:tRNA A37 methylthiotransferase MiaB